MPNIDLLFLLLGAVLVLAMHAGFAFLELGTVRHKNQVNALSKILTDFAISAVAYFLVGYYIAYGQHFFHSSTTLAADHGYNLMRCFFLLTFAAAIPAIISGGIAERAKMRSQALATLFLVALIYPFFEGMIWNGNFGLQLWLAHSFGASFHDFAGSVVVHAMGGWIALAAVILLGARYGRYKIAGKDDPGFLHNGPLAGLVAICAGSDVVHPLGAFVIGGIAGIMFVKLFTYTQNKLKIDDVLGVWPLHGVCGAFGGLAVGIFGQQWLGGMGGVSLISQLFGTALAILIALAGGFLVYGVLKLLMGIRLSQEEEFNGADLSIHRISANSEENMF
ncbi:ammonium transporter [Acinetobacter indicus]|uniref:ammonium transporter n=1 Tax=Acinetobacter indicus TaxID=756892 RepID=UPI0025787CB5|nr:ammonium transporter [Acinetobacter indicus]MDM1329865.1 ammonium transporter [Acinetobacter indicus]MDM1338201.1 ammonium transporter [Acinetobacter indicus]